MGNSESGEKEEKKPEALRANPIPKESEERNYIHFPTTKIFIEEDKYVSENGIYMTIKYWENQQVFL